MLKITPELEDGPIEIRVIKDIRTYPNSANRCLVLLQDNWDDFGFKTTFKATLFDDNSASHEIGYLNIAKSNMESGYVDVSSGTIDKLDEPYFSLGHEEYYDSIKSVPRSVREHIYRALRDVAYDLSLWDTYKEEKVTQTSLLRGLTERTVKEQLRRIALGPSQYINNLNKKYTLTSTLNHKFSAAHTNRTGFIVNNLHYNNLLKYAPSIGDDLLTTADENGSSNLIHLYSQSKINLSSRLVFNLGMHGLYFDSNKELVLEPRIGATYHLTNRQSISLAYGKHSRLEPQSLYFARVMEGNEALYPNKTLSLSKAHHFVLAYDINLSPNVRLKVEPYFQYLYDIPVSPDSSYSTINMEADWFFTEKLVNHGTGTNLGIDLTLERFLKDGFYYLFTASLFESKYVGGDGIERSSRYNSNYVVNVLVGKEWTMGISQNKFLGVNARLNMMGGQRAFPLDRASSITQGDVIYDYSRPFEDQKPNIIHLNASLTYRINKKKHASIWSIQVLNLLGAEENYGYAYNYRTDQLESNEVVVMVPSVSYKIEF